MGKSKASVTVAEVSEAELDLDFQQQQILTQLHGFQEAVTLINLRQDDLQHHMADLQQSLANLNVHQTQQSKFQQTLIEEIRSLKHPPPTQPSPQIPIGSILVSLGSGPFSTAHTTFPLPTWSTSPSPSRTTPFVAGPSTLSYDHTSFPIFTHTTGCPPLSVSGVPFSHTLVPDPQSAHHFPPLPSPISPHRHLKIELPCFFGKDPYGWIAIAKEFLDYHEVEDHRRATVAGLHFGRDAAHWLRWYKMRFSLSSWATFTTQLLQHFRPTESLNFHMALSHITQIGSVEDYVARFIRLSCWTLDWSDEQLLGTFLGGLKEDLQDDVVAQRPASLARAIELARIYETKQRRRSNVRSGFTQSSSTHSKPFLPSIAAPFMSTTASRPLPPATPTPLPKPILRLTQAEMRARREQGLCFNCDEQYRLGHRCRQSHILMLLTDEDFFDFQSEPETSDPSDPSLGEQLAPPIALNAISATKRSRG
ncbi:hypothetical protein ACFX10_032941 [Malus domestica]